MPRQTGAEPNCPSEMHDRRANSASGRAQVPLTQSEERTPKKAGHEVAGWKQHGHRNPRRQPDSNDIKTEHHNRKDLSDLGEQGAFDDCELDDRLRASLAVAKILPSERPKRVARYVIDRSFSRQPNGSSCLPAAVIEFEIFVARGLVISADTTEVL